MKKEMAATDAADVDDATAAGWARLGDRGGAVDG
jgi:hypothetical protein